MSPRADMAVQMIIVHVSPMLLIIIEGFAAERAERVPSDHLTLRIALNMETQLFRRVQYEVLEISLHVGKANITSIPSHHHLDPQRSQIVIPVRYAMLGLQMRLKLLAGREVVLARGAGHFQQLLMRSERSLIEEVDVASALKLKKP